MRLKVLVPTGIVADEEVEKVTAEAENGSFTLLPRHIDFVAALVPGLLSFATSGGESEVMAVDKGILVKRGTELLVSVRRAFRGAALGELKKTVEEYFRVLDEHEKSARSAVARLEADIARRFKQMRDLGYEIGE